MPPDSDANSQQISKAFEEYNRQVTLQNIRIGCILGMILMPAGFVLDYLYLPDIETTIYFLKLRFLCSVLIGLFWLIVATPFGRRHHRQFGIALAMIPSLFISWMIYEKGGSQSPYYAGLNLVLLVVGFVLQWTFIESITAVSLVLLMYLAACYFSAETLRLRGIFFNNLYFLVVTGVIVATGNYFASKLRYREFALRFQLDRNREQLEESNRKLQELDEAKSRFFANISHELRTPLTLLLAPLESLLNERERAFDPGVQDWLQTMHVNGMRLLKLINDLLDLVRLESGKLELKKEACRLEDFIAGICNSVQKVADDKGLRLETEVDANLGVVMIDRDKMEKVMLNLLFNSIKFTPAGGRIAVDARVRDSRIELKIQDSGMGIAKENLKHLFSRFWQADTSSQRKYQGVGIGLALVKELVELHEGDVKVESFENRGTAFTIRVPLERAEAGEKGEGGRAISGIAAESAVAVADAAPSEKSPPTEEWLSKLYRRAELFPSMTSLRASIRSADFMGQSNLPGILIADDEPDMLRFLKSQLRRHYRVHEAVDGQQAIDLARQVLPDIILCDMMMPEKDGLEVCHELRAYTPTQGIPILLLTARADEATKIRALELGANDFLPKPFSSTELHLRLKNLVESHSLQNRLSRQNQILESTLEQLKETETQLVQSEKLASLGRMSAGIIHEINNPLNFANTALYTLRGMERFVPDGDREDFKEVVKDIKEGIQRVQTIVSDLRTFTHSSQDHREDIELEAVLDMSLRFLSHEWKDRVAIRRDMPEGFRIHANKNQVSQVLVNLLQNALDAMRGKEYADGETPCIEVRAEESNRMRKVSLRDNGPGIASGVLSNIFDPFFTTKDVGEGMGLGLSICYKILEQHGGRIQARSELGKFSEFTLEFPCKDDRMGVD